MQLAGMHLLCILSKNNKTKAQGVIIVIFNNDVIQKKNKLKLEVRCHTAVTSHACITLTFIVNKYTSLAFSSIPQMSDYDSDPEDNSQQNDGCKLFRTLALYSSSPI